MDFRVPFPGLKSPKLSAQAIQAGLLGDMGDMPFLDPMVLLRSNPRAAVGSMGDEGHLVWQHLLVLALGVALFLGFLHGRQDIWTEVLIVQPGLGQHAVKKQRTCCKWRGSITMIGYD